LPNDKHGDDDDDNRMRDMITQTCQWRNL